MKNLTYKYIRFWNDDYESDSEKDLRDYKIIANASGEYGGIDAKEARERIKNRHLADSYSGGM